MNSPKPRIINSQMNISLPVELHERLREHAWQERKTLSHVCREMREAGLEGLRQNGAATNGTNGKVAKTGQA